MTKRKKKKEDGQTINDIVDWQNHQYDPGYYTGGNIPHYIRKPGRLDLLGWSFILTGFLTIVFFLGTMKFFATDEETVGFGLYVLIYGLISIATISAGVRYLLKARQNYGSSRISTTKIVVFILLAVFTWFIAGAATFEWAGSRRHYDGDNITTWTTTFKTPVTLPISIDYIAVLNKNNDIFPNNVLTTKVIPSKENRYEISMTFNLFKFKDNLPTDLIVVYRVCKVVPLVTWVKI